jgi:prepilin-type N-terminal cleavage/methylation domain-containing protein
MKISGSARRGSGFTFIEMIIVITIIGLLVAIAIPCSIRARDNSRLSGIRHNLRQIEGAKTQWAIENKKTTGDPVGNIAVLSNYFSHNSGVHDVMRETYVPNAIGTPAEADLPKGASLGTNGPVIPAD